MPNEAKTTRIVRDHFTKDSLLTIEEYQSDDEIINQSLKKASKAHARQADILLNILEDQKTDYVKTKKRPKSRNRKKTKG